MTLRFHGAACEGTHTPAPGLPVSHGGTRTTATAPRGREHTVGFKVESAKNIVFSSCINYLLKLNPITYKNDWSVNKSK